MNVETAYTGGPVADYHQKKNPKAFKHASPV